MLKLAGVIMILITSLGVGYVLGDSLKNRLRSIEALSVFVDYVSMNIEVYRAPLHEIFESFNDKYLSSTGFIKGLNCGVYESAISAGLLCGDEEKEIIKAFSDKIGSGCTEDMVKLCSYTSSRLRGIAERLRKDLPDKQRIYRTISALTGVSLVIMLV